MEYVGTQIFCLGMTIGAAPRLFDGCAEGGPGAESGGDSCLEEDVWVVVAAAAAAGGGGGGAGIVGDHDC